LYLPLDPIAKGGLMWFRRKYHVGELAEFLAAHSVKLSNEELEGIQKVATEGSLDRARVHREYQFLKIYALETALQNVEKYSDEAVTTYRRALEATSGRPYEEGEFLPAYTRRMSHYDEAWQDPRGVGWGVAMSSAFAELCTERRSR
jgi:hypothetical protein